MYRSNYNTVCDIAMITDENYIMPTIVAIESLNSNSDKNVLYNVNILTNNLSEDSIALLKTPKFSNINLNIIDCSYLIKEFTTVNQSRHVTYAAMLKFYLPEIFSNLDKILYLDGDILIQKDLAELFNIDINNYYAAVTRDTLGVLNKKHLESLGIKNEFYFNSGVLLLNLKSMREDHIKDKLIEFRISKKQHFMDQDAFNAVIGQNVKYISYKFNFLNYYLTVMSVKDLSKLYEEDLTIFKDDKSIYKSCSIIHLGGKEKPWIYNLGYLSKIYKDYYNKTVLGKKKLKLKSLKNSFIQNIFSIKNDNRNHKVLTILGLKIKFKRSKANV